MTRLKHCATAPSAWSSYLMNGDASDLDDNERQWCDEWIKWLGLGSPVECEDAGFRKRHDAFAFDPQAARCLRYTFCFPDFNRRSVNGRRRRLTTFNGRCGVRRTT